MMNHTSPSQERLQDVLFFKHENTWQLKAEDILANDQALFYEEPRATFQMCCQYITKSTGTLHYEELPMQVSHCT